MRLTRFQVTRYGNFDDIVLRFDPAPGRLNLLVAPNGAGKSVLRRAFHDLLFGVETQSDMKHRAGYARMRLSAEALAPDGAPFGFAWDRKQGRVFDDQARHEPVFRRSLGAITPSQLKLLFALDTTALRLGGQQLAHGGDTLGAALLSGTGELAPIRQVRHALEQRRAAGWAKRKSTPPLNRALAALAAARNDLRRAIQPPAEREKREAAVAEAVALRRGSVEAQNAARIALSRLARIDRVRQPLADLRTAAEWFAAHPDAPLLDPSLVTELRRLQGSVVEQANERRLAEIAVHDSCHRRDAIPIDLEALAAADALDRLAELVGAAKKSRDDRKNVDLEHRETLKQIAALGLDIGSVAVPPPAPLRAEANLAIKRHAAHETAMANARKRVGIAQQRLNGLTVGQSIEPLASHSDRELALLLVEIRRDRDPLRHLTERASAARAARSKAAKALRQVPGWSQGAGSLAIQGLPPPAELDRLDVALRQAAEALAATQELAGQAAEALAARERRLEELSTQGELPDAVRLAAARARRDTGVALLVVRAADPAQADRQAELAYAGADSLQSRLDRDIRAADAVADHWIAEAGQVAAAGELRARLAEERAQNLHAHEAADAAGRSHAAALDAWRLALAALLPRGSTRAEVRAFAEARDAALDAESEAAEAETALKDTQTAHAAWAVRLAAQLGVPDTGLPDLLTKGDARLAAAEAAEKDAIRLRAEWRAVQEGLATELADYQAVQDSVAVAETQWAALLMRLQRPAGEPPPVTASVLDQLAKLDELRRQAAKLSERLDGMSGDIAGFAGAADTLADRLGTASDPDSFALAERLLARGVASRMTKAGRDQADLDVADAAGKHAAAVRAHATAISALDVFVASCGANHPDAAERRLLLAHERQAFVAMHARALASLANIADGRDEAELRREVAAHAPDEMPDLRAAAEAAQEAADFARDQANTAVVIAEQALAGEGGVSATDASACHAEAAASVSRLLEDQLVIDLAVRMLGQAIERVEASAGIDGVARIEAAFRALTAGAYGVAAEEDSKGEMLLRAIDSRFPEGPMPLDALSEGTRDQLFLALRLVAIADHAAQAAPMPFLIDDVLQTFDDARAHAALAALADFSKTTQVIVLTHHPHLRALADGLPVHHVEIESATA